MRPSATASALRIPARSVPTVAKPAASEKRPQLDERMRDRPGFDVRKTERLQPGRIDDPAVAQGGGQQMQCRVRRRMAPRGQRLGDFRGLRARRRGQSHSGSSTCPCPTGRSVRSSAGEPGSSGVASIVADNSTIGIRAGRRARAARGAASNPGDRTCSPRARIGTPAPRRRSPSVDQLLVERQSGRHDAADLRDVGGDQLFAESVGAVEEATRAARPTRSTPPPAPARCHAIAAGEHRARGP